MVNRPIEAPASPLLEQAAAARSRFDWRTAAILFTAAADELPPEPSGEVSATEIGLRRDAHLCLNRTDEFKQHRERQRKLDPRNDFRDQWFRPSGDLVKLLLEPRARAAS